MIRGRTDPGMDTAFFGIFQGFSSHVDIFFFRSCQGGDDGIADDFGNLDNGFEIARAGNRETGFDDVHTQFFQSFCHLDFFKCIQLAPGDLFPVAQGRIEYDDFFC